MRTAIDLGKQIYVFVEKAVLGEYRTYLGNREVAGFKPVAVNDVKVYGFVEDIYALPSGNPIEAFETSDDIFRFLREQWAGLFQRLLQESSRQNEIGIIEGLKSTAATLNHLVTFLTEERSKGDLAIRDILLSTHPAFSAVKSAAKIPYRVIFYTYEELDALLGARNFRLDDVFAPEGSYDWDNAKAGYGVRVRKEIFDEDGKLKIFQPDEWNGDWVERYSLSKSPDPIEDIPF